MFSPLLMGAAREFGVELRATAEQTTTIPTETQPGDLIIAATYDGDGRASTPGWSEIGYSSAGFGSRHRAITKIAEAGDAGGSVNPMTGGVERRLILVFAGGFSELEVLESKSGGDTSGIARTLSTSFHTDRSLLVSSTAANGTHGGGDIEYDGVRDSEDGTVSVGSNLYVHWKNISQLSPAEATARVGNPGTQHLAFAHLKIT